jgi:hypothetical protein
MADNVQIVLNAFETLFNKRDYAAAERFWSPNYIAPGREGLFEFVKTLPDTLRYDNHVAAASGNCVIPHGRFSTRNIAGEEPCRTSISAKPCRPNSRISAV